MRALVTVMSLAAATPATAGAPVAMDGCYAGYVIFFFPPGGASVFDPSKDHPRSRRSEQLLDHAWFGWSQLRGSVTVTAHVDDAEAASDVTLGWRRARAVKQALVAKGIPPEKIDTFDVGAATPLIPEPDNPSEAQNRFVEVRIENPKNECLTGESR